MLSSRKEGHPAIQLVTNGSLSQSKICLLLACELPGEGPTDVEDAPVR